MMRKAHIAYFIFTVAVLYIISPWFFEKKLLFNEVLALSGFFILIYKRMKTGNDPISICMVLLLAWSFIHVITSLARMDTLYYYFRNMVIFYSMLSFFIGFYLLRYLGPFIRSIRKALRVYIGTFLFIPLPRTLFERFGVAMLFPALFNNSAKSWVRLLLVLMCIVYGITYDSFTSILLAAFFTLVFISPGYKFFIQVMACFFLVCIAMFIYLHPNLELISYKWTFSNDNPIRNVMHSHPLLDIDGNSTWRLVLWNELTVHNFPANIFGIGFGTPALKYYPVEDYSKLQTLPYVLGGHNSFVYLFARLGIVYVLITLYMYAVIFKEYFYYKAYYYANNQALIFWSFFVITVIASFNPTLESPIYASAFWMLLGFVARAIYNRRKNIQTA